MTLDSPLRVEIERLEAAMRSRLGGQVRELRLVANGRGFVLLGRARTYYAKQLAQQAAIVGTPLPLLANEIEVRQAARSEAGKRGGDREPSSRSGDSDESARASCS